MCPVTQNEQDQTIRCVVAHDIAWLRQGVRRLLDDEPDITVVAEAEDAVQTLRDVFTHRPDIVVVDHHIFEGTAVQTERLIVRESPSSKVLFLTNHDEESRGDDLADAHCRNQTPDCDADQRRGVADVMTPHKRKTKHYGWIPDLPDHRDQRFERPELHVRIRPERPAAAG